MILHKYIYIVFFFSGLGMKDFNAGKFWKSSDIASFEKHLKVLIIGSSDCIIMKTTPPMTLHDFFSL